METRALGKGFTQLTCLSCSWDIPFWSETLYVPVLISVLCNDVLVLLLLLSFMHAFLCLWQINARLEIQRSSTLNAEKKAVKLFHSILSDLVPKVRNPSLWQPHYLSSMFSSTLATAAEVKQRKGMPSTVLKSAEREKREMMASRKSERWQEYSEGPSEGDPGTDNCL